MSGSLLGEIEEAAAAVWEAGGRPGKLVMHPDLAAKLEAEFATRMSYPVHTLDAEGRMVVVSSDDPSRRGGSVLRKIETEFGSLPVVIDPLCPPNQFCVMGSE